MNRAVLTGWMLFAAVCGCQKDGSTPPTAASHPPGKNRFTTTVDGDAREYFVHVPARYDEGIPTPVVFMLHGTTGDGERFYNISGWKEVGETEGILTVFPSSWRYCIIDEGIVRNTTKWNSYPGAFAYCAGEVPRDDVLFLRRVLAEVEERFNVDSKRIYLAGFSSGGSMAFRCAVEMSDVLAAVVEASGSAARDTTAVPRRDLPVTFQLGSSDDMWLGSRTAAVPMGLFESTLRGDSENVGVVRTHTSTFHFDENFALSGDTNTVLVATYPALPGGGDRQFNFLFIKGLDHNYPNGENHWFRAAEQHWAWMKRYTLP